MTHSQVPAVELFYSRAVARPRPTRQSAAKYVGAVLVAFGCLIALTGIYLVARGESVIAVFASNVRPVADPLGETLANGLLSVGGQQLGGIAMMVTVVLCTVGVALRAKSA